MKVQVWPVGYVLTQKDLRELAEDFCKRELAAPIELEKLGVGWVAYQIEGEKPVKATAIAALKLAIDVPLLRFMDSKSGRKIIERMFAYAADQGNCGQSALVYVSSKEAPEQRCAAQAEWLRAMGAVKADRWEVVIR